MFNFLSPSKPAGDSMDSNNKSSEPATETTPLVTNRKGKDADDNEDESMSMSDLDGSDYFGILSGKGDAVRRESIAADKLSTRLLEIDDDDDEAEDLILHEVLNVEMDMPLITSPDKKPKASPTAASKAKLRFYSMTSLFVLAFAVIGTLIWISNQFIGPPNQPVGAYQLIERQEGDNFFDYYTFLKGPDSVGSNGYVTYVEEERAKELGIASMSHEVDELDDFFSRRRSLSTADGEETPKKEPFVYLKTAATDAGPRESVRLEGKRKFNRGLFIIDVRHIPVGCGAWPAFWLTDEANWPVNGEIDIVEGINFQDEAKTALHTTRGCDMFDVPVGTMTGTWDTAVGIPDKKTGIPDMTFREARNCFVYDRHQWLNQGCVTIDTEGGSLGKPLNEKGGGIFVLEWDPAYRHIRTWVFSPHTTVPENLVDAIRTASAELESDRVMPNPEAWPLPYGFFPIGAETNCEGTKFRNMHLVLNIALCGSVSGNRFYKDCTDESKVYKSCEEYIKSRPEALSEFYWKIRGVYVYQRAWEKAWLGH